ncbi:hypothetical protein M405DRAFT_933253 [Rhizopogon salebrosus TDB-379]|nr:hypothetical protein M405DRAFT_933253 [Rhizopogon salebrosus TDB-379]
MSRKMGNFLGGHSLERVGFCQTSCLFILAYRFAFIPTTTWLNFIFLLKFSPVRHQCWKPLVEEDGDFKYRDSCYHAIESIEDLPMNRHENGRDAARDDTNDEFAPSTSCGGGNDLSRLRTQMVACNTAAKTHAPHSERPPSPPAKAAISPPPPARDLAPLTSLPSSPGRNHSPSRPSRAGGGIRESVS